MWKAIGGARKGRVGRRAGKNQVEGAGERLRGEKVTDRESRQEGERK